MNNTDKLLGGKCQLVSASGITPILPGYRAYAMKVRVDNTQITSVTEIEDNTAPTGSPATGIITDETWQNVNLLSTDYISLEDPIISITLASGTDSVMLFLEQR